MARISWVKTFAAAGGLGLLTSAAPAHAYSQMPLPDTSRLDTGAHKSLLNRESEQRKQQDLVNEALAKYGIIKRVPTADGYSTITNPMAVTRLDKNQKRDLLRVLSKSNLAPADIPKGAEAELAIHIVNALTNPGSAMTYLTEQALPKQKLSVVDVAKMQIAFNILGYDSGAITGAFNEFTATALERFFKENPIETLSAKGAVIAAMGQHLDTERMNKLFEDNPDYKPVSGPNATKLARTTSEGYSLLNPELIVAMNSDERIAGWIDLTRRVALEHGLDPNMQANQFWEESISMIHGNPKKFGGPKPEIVSFTGCCKGIAQFSGPTGKDYNLFTDEDFFDPEKSIRAGVKYMADLTKQYKGDQKMALAVYNGGPKPIIWAARETKKGDALTSADLVKFLQSQIKHTPVAKRKNSWAFQTGNYPPKIASVFWPDSKIERAHKYAENQTPVLVALDKPRQVASKETSQCILASQQDAMVTKINERVSAEVMSVPGMIGDYGKVSPEAMTLISKIEKQVDPDNERNKSACTPVNNSARFFNEAVHATGRMAPERITTPAHFYGAPSVRTF